MTVLPKWSIRFNIVAQKQFEKLDRPVQQRIQRFLRERLLKTSTPCQWGKAMTGEFSEFWRYRIGDYRVVCKIEDQTLIVLLVCVAHRGEVYD